MSGLGRNETVVTLGVFALGLTNMSGILIVPLVLAQEAALVPAAQLSHTKSIQPNVTKPVYVPMNSNDYINEGITHGSTRNGADVIVNQDGTYLIMAAGQVGKTSGNITCNVDLWLNENREHIPNSNTRVSVNTVNDTINIIMSVSATGQGCGLLNIAPSGEPNIPSIIFTIVRIGNR